MEKPSDEKVVEAVRLIVRDEKVLHPYIETNNEIVQRACYSFTSGTIPEEEDACALAIAVLEHISLVHADLGPEYVMTLLPLGLQFFSERELDAEFGLAGLPFMETCLHYFALGLLAENFMNAVLVAAERVIVEEDGYVSYAEIAILMAKAYGADGMVRNLLGLEGIRDKLVTGLFDFTGQAIGSQDTLRSVLGEYYLDEEDVDCIYQSLLGDNGDSH